MRSLLTILVLLAISFSAYSQVFPLLPKYYQPLDSSVLNNNDKEEQEKKETLMKRHKGVSYSVALGTGYTSFGSDLSMMNSYIAPTIDYQVNSRFNISVTGIFMRNNISGMEGFYGNEPGYTYNANPSNYGITGSAYYQLNDKWSVWGDGAYMENQSMFNSYSADFYNTDFKTVSLGVGYQVNEKVQFHIQYRYSDGLNPAYNFNSPFYNRYNDPYRSNFGIWGY